MPGGALALNDALSSLKTLGHGRDQLQTDRSAADLRELFTGVQGGRLQSRPFRVLSQLDSSSGTAAIPVSGNGSICISATQPNCGGIVASGSDLRFKPEINDAFEIGAKFNGRGIDVNLALFHQVFRDFQLNTFNGLNFVVETINSCSESLNGADKDTVPTPAHAPAICVGGVEKPGLRARGFHSAAERLAMECRRDHG